jgi:alanyl-tRNA synthetase
MMSDTGPCGPGSEIHFNLLPSDDELEGRNGVNSRCIEIWNHVFIQFNANAFGKPSAGTKAMADAIIAQL